MIETASQFGEKLCAVKSLKNSWGQSEINAAFRAGIAREHIDTR
jgi:hypothetical protein